MFSKVSIKSFVYDLIDVFMFPTEETKKNLQWIQMRKGFAYQNLTDRDSTSIFFAFICNFLCSVNEKNSRKIIFKVLIWSKILQHLDIFDDFQKTLWRSR